MHTCTQRLTFKVWTNAEYMCVFGKFQHFNCFFNTQTGSYFKNLNFCFSSSHSIFSITLFLSLSLLLFFPSSPPAYTSSSPSSLPGVHAPFFLSSFSLPSYCFSRSLQFFFFRPPFIFPSSVSQEVLFLWILISNMLPKITGITCSLSQEAICLPLHHFRILARLIPHSDYQNFIVYR